MDRYTDHRGTKHAPMKDVAGLKSLKNDAVGMLHRFGAIHRLVKMRIEWLADGVDALYAQLDYIVEELLVDERKALVISLVFGFAVRGKSMLETVDDRDEAFDHARGGSLGIFEALLFDALAVILKIRLPALERLAQLLEVRRQLGHLRVGFLAIGSDGLGLRARFPIRGIHISVDVDIAIDVLLGHLRTSPVSMDFLNLAQRFTEKLRHVGRSEEHTSELQSRSDLVCRLLLEKKNTSCFSLT